VHEQEDHTLRAGRKVRLSNGQRIRAGSRSRPQLLFAQQAGERDGSKARATDAQQFPSRKRAVEIGVPVTVHTFL
jgi:hypothetical protein